MSIGSHFFIGLSPIREQGWLELISHMGSMGGILFLSGFAGRGEIPCETRIYMGSKFKVFVLVTFDYVVQCYVFII